MLGTLTPLGYTLLVLAIGAVGGLVCAGLWALLRRVRPAAGSVAGSTALARAGSYAGLALLLGVSAALGLAGITVLVTVLGALALVEWCRLTDLPRHHRVVLQVANVAIMVVIAVLGPAGTEWLIGGLILLGIVWPVARPDTDRAMRDFGFAALGCIIVSGMLVHGIGLVVADREIGVVLFVALAVGAAGADVGAFVVGRRYGRTPLAPRLSPNKTREGLVGAAIGAGLGILVFAPALATSLGPLFLVGLVPLVTLGSVWGDLLESAAKREAGVKDAGSWLPGFGGILDRIDSLLVVLPLTYWAIRVLAVAQGT